MSVVIDMGLNDAEIQLLASLEKARIDGTGTDRTSLEKAGERYWIFREDVSEAFESLREKGLIAGGEAAYRLTKTGQPLATAYQRERPDMYWYYYRSFYPAARASAAHSRLCERVFGQDLTQEGMTDMAALHHLLHLLDLKPGDHLLDLGCGAGVIAEYVADRTGARVTVLDYAVAAIAEARERNKHRAPSLTFVTGDMNALDLPARSFDAAISLDTLYWVADIEDTLAQVAKSVKPGGQIGIFMLANMLQGGQWPKFDASQTELGRALAHLNLAFDAYDYTDQNAEFWRRNYETAKALRQDFEAEGNGFIAASLIREAEEDFLPAIESGTLARYLYHVRL